MKKEDVYIWVVYGNVKDQNTSPQMTKLLFGSTIVGALICKDIRLTWEWLQKEETYQQLQCELYNN